MARLSGLGDQFEIFRRGLNKVLSYAELQQRRLSPVPSHPQSESDHPGSSMLAR